MKMKLIITAILTLTLPWLSQAIDDLTYNSLLKQYSDITNYQVKVDTTWQLDHCRREADRIDKQYGKMALNCYRSALDLITTNTIELGYRSDGTVIWRIPPEAYLQGLTNNSCLFVTNYQAVNSATNTFSSVIKEMAKSGELCKTIGHQWHDHTHVTLEYSPNRIGCRECGVCGLHQSRYADDWR